jgi:hypothetical protein
VSPDQSTLVATKMSIRRAKMAPATFALLRKACIMGTLAAPDGGKEQEV